MPRFPALLAVLALCIAFAACSSTGGSAAPSATGGSASPSSLAPTPSLEPSPASSLATIGQPADDGARIVKVETLDERTRDLTIESPAVGTMRVRLLLPSAFADQPATRFPVLYLLHGAGGEYTDWTLNTDVEALTEPTNLLVAMPEGSTSGIDGWYTNWVTPGEVGQQNWETFHLTELRQLLERNWQAGEDRVIAGNSMGGYGAVAYAGRYPDLFKGVAALSGALDMKTATERFNDPYELIRWGDRVVDEANWVAHDPVALAPRLRDMALYLSFGDGQPGPLDPGRTDLDELEAWIGAGNLSFLEALDQAGIEATVNAYGPGTHSWPYWERELHAALPMLLEAVGAN